MIFLLFALHCCCNNLNFPNEGLAKAFYSILFVQTRQSSAVARCVEKRKISSLRCLTPSVSRWFRPSSPDFYSLGAEPSLKRLSTSHVCMSLLCFLFCSPHFIFFYEAFFCFLVFVVFASASFFSVAEPLFFFLSTLLLFFALCLFFSSCLALAPSLLFFDKTLSCPSWCVYYLAVLCPLLPFSLAALSPS